VTGWLLTGEKAEDGRQYGDQVWRRRTGRRGKRRRRRRRRRRGEE
jgi:hypothetical protein